ncbi:MTAP family purine nucleoside phosphorylase [Methanocalculus sp. MSAO_Arc2]|uniref:MTAP family purine nucleoside phosphorylase n=1 Tax=Methanocalculus sp. MSAO_Arc2 TaxID=2293855 RepID=UPI00321753C9
MPGRSYLASSGFSPGFALYSQVVSGIGSTRKPGEAPGSLEKRHAQYNVSFHQTHPKNYIVERKPSPSIILRTDRSTDGSQICYGAGTMLGIIGGTSLFFADLPPLEEKIIPTPYGKALVYTGDICLIPRHQNTLPPHNINHRAHIAALKILGVDRIVAFGSVGSLHVKYPPGSLLIPKDFISWGKIPTFHDTTMVHVMPGFDHNLIIALANMHPDIKIGGTYIQTTGPRFETVAEVQTLSRIADMVGMTVASEATLAAELKIKIAAICTVDNYANGIGDELISYETIVAAAKEGSARISLILERVVEELQ